MTDRPFSPACDRNSQPIFEVLQIYIDEAESATLFEIGSGTGQHAAYLAKRFPNLRWRPSDTKENHAGIEAWTSDIENVAEPIEYLAGNRELPVNFDFYFTANTLHIMSWDEALILFEDLGDAMKSQSTLFIYGPFNVEGQFTSESNQAFDQNLKQRDPKSGIRDLEDVVEELSRRDIKKKASHKMPANNFFLAFQKD